MTHHQCASATPFQKTDVAFDTATLLWTLAKDANYMAALAEYSRRSGLF